jgi:hypothetical protein
LANSEICVPYSYGLCSLRRLRRRIDFRSFPRKTCLVNCWMLLLTS